MTKRPVTHYFWSDLPFDFPAYCRPTMEVKQSTDQLEAVTCEACLRKLEKNPDEFFQEFFHTKGSR